MTTLGDVFAKIQELEVVLNFCGATADFMRERNSHVEAIANAFFAEQGVERGSVAARKVSRDTVLGQTAQQRYDEFLKWLDDNRAFEFR